jgi:nucleotide-binding universal stress UspA family protein
MNAATTVSGSPISRAEQVAAPSPPPVFTRILVPTDFSHRSETAIGYAVEIASSMNAHLTILHVIPEPSAFEYTLAGLPPGELDQAKETIEKKLAEETSRTKLVYREVDSLLRTGLDLCDEILKTARELSTDLLILSTHGYTGWKHLLLGSDAERILEHAQCPVLIVH